MKDRTALTNAEALLNEVSEMLERVTHWSFVNSHYNVSASEINATRQTQEGLETLRAIFEERLQQAEDEYYKK